MSLPTAKSTLRKHGKDYCVITHHQFNLHKVFSGKDVLATFTSASVRLLAPSKNGRCHGIGVRMTTAGLTDRT